VPLPAAEALPPRAVVVILHLSPAGRHMYAACFRPSNGAFGLQREPVPAGFIEALTEEVAAVEEDRVSTLNGDIPDVAAAVAVAERWSDLCERTSALLEPVLRPLAPVLEVGEGGEKHHIVLCVSPSLLPLPLETHPLLLSAKAVTRDISVWHAEQRMEVAAAGDLKVKPESLRYCVDCLGETDGQLMSGVVGERAVPAGWDGISGTRGTPDAPADSRFPSAAEIQRLLALQVGPRCEPPPNGAPAPCVLAIAGRLGSALDIRNIASLDLTTQRCLVIADRTVNGQSHRRESSQDTRKSAAQIRLEISSSIAILLLARGATGLVVNSHSSSVAHNSQVVRALVGNIEKGGSTAEFVQSLRRATEDQTSRKSVAATPVREKAPAAPAKGGKDKGAAVTAEPDAALAALPLSVRFNPVTYGVL